MPNACTNAARTSHLGYMAFRNDGTIAVISGRRWTRWRQRRVRLGCLGDQSWHCPNRKTFHQLCWSAPHCVRERLPQASCEDADEPWAA